MGVCAVCGNDYDRTFTITAPGHGPETFDSFACAIHLLAPTCGHCGQRVIGHGVEVDQVVYCCAHCARSVGQPGPVDRSDTPPAQSPGTFEDSNDLRGLDRDVADTFPASDPVPTLGGQPGGRSAGSDAPP